MVLEAILTILIKLEALGLNEKCFGLLQAQGQRLKAHSQNVVLLSIGIKVTKAWEHYITLTDSSLRC